MCHCAQNLRSVTYGHCFEAFELGTRWHSIALVIDPGIPIRTPA